MVALPPWNERAPQAAAILNPALLASVTGWSAYRYRRELGVPMPWELAFLTAPLVLHRLTREAMPSTARTHLAAWVNDHAGVLAGFGTRARAFAPYVREGLRHGHRAGLLHLDEDGGITVTIPTKTKLVDGTERAEIVRAAGVTGVWFARAGSTANAYIQFGVKP